MLYCECNIEYSPSSMSTLSESPLLAIIAISPCFPLPLYRVQLALFHRFTEDVGTIVTFSQIGYNRCFDRTGSGSVWLRLLAPPIAIVFFFMGSLLADDQPVRFNHLTVDDGLSQNSCRSILEDSQGFMWFGTRFGLNRYDGKQFKVFLSDPLDTTSLPGFWINCLAEDQDGIMWVGTRSGGLGRYNRELESFENFKHHPNDSNSLAHNSVTALCTDSDGFLWVGTEHGLSKYNKQTNTFINFYQNPDSVNTLPSNRISALAEMPDRRLCVGTENGALVSLSLDDYSIQTMMSAYTGSVQLKSIHLDSINNDLWVARFGLGLVKYDLLEQSWSYYVAEDLTTALSVAGTISISQDRAGRLWLASAIGLASYDPQSEKFELFLNDPDEHRSLGDNLLYCSYIDRQGILWLGTESDGVNFYDPHLIRFTQKRYEPDNPNSIRNDMVFSVSEDYSGNIWFGTMGGGTSVMDVNTGQFQHFNTIGIDYNWSKDYVYRVIMDRSQKVWIGTSECGVFVLDYPTKTFNHYNNREDVANSFGDKTAKDILEARDGSIWIATETQGLDRYDVGSNSFEHFRHDPQDSTSISSNFTYSLLEDQAGYIWIGTNDKGLNQFDRKTGKFVHFQVESQLTPALPSNCVVSLYEDDNRNLWIGTRSGGLNRLDPQRQTITTMDLHTDLASQAIFGVLEDDHGYLWVSSNMGILKIDPDSGLLNAYTMSDGVQSDFYYQSRVKTRNGSMYFGGDHGYNVFHPDSIRNSSFIPPLFFTGLSINYEPVPIGEDRNGRTILTRSISQTEKLELTYRDKVIRFEFAALNFSASHKNLYAYMLDGYDQDWIDTYHHPTAQYMNLPAGEYTFRVRGSNNDGVWNMKGASIAISIAPPFWKTWWFKTLAIVSLLGFILTYIQLRTYRLVAQRDKLEALVRERTAQLKVEIEERQRVELEKNKLKMDHLKRELLTQSLHLNDKQQIMDNLQGELESFSKLSWNEVKPRIKKLLRFLRDRSSVKQGWEDFDIWFTEIHTGFYSELRSNHPGLSENELKVCALLRLNLISKDIAKVMNVQPSSIDIYRHRIRKKLEIGSEENLSTFLSKY